MGHIRDIRLTPPNAAYDLFRKYYGPTYKAFAALDETRQKALNDALVAFLGRWNTRKNTLVIPGEYLEAVITK